MICKRCTFTVAWHGVERSCEVVMNDEGGSSFMTVKVAFLPAS
jgi:hypothetical protein